MRTADRPRSLTDEILDEMTTILVAAQNITLRVQAATNMAPTDRETLLRTSTHICAHADAILVWLFESPLDTDRH